MKTQSFNAASSNLGATLKQGTKMIFGSDVSNYTLVFLDPTTSDKAQTSKMIVVPNITIGRGSACHVRYGDEYSTVSRQHASITGSGNQFFLNHNPQASNPTFINGQPVHGPHLLKNEDMIQFSQNGPRMRYLASAVKTSTMGMTARVNRVLGQAIRPYKRALGILSFILFTSLLFGGYNYYKSTELEKDVLSLNEKAKAVEDELVSATQESERLQAEISRNKNISDKERQAAVAKQKKLEEKVKQLAQKEKEIQKLLNEKNTNDKGNPKLDNAGNTNAVVNFETLPTDDIYYIYATKYEVADDQELISEVISDRGGIFSGTAFLTEDNLLVTARHNMQPYRFFKDSKSLVYNFLEAHGARIIVTFEALNKKGDRFTFNTKNAVFNDASDETITLESEDSSKTWQGKLRSNNSSDWAYIKIGSRKGSIKYDRELSKVLKTGTDLYPVGFTYGEAFQPTQGDIKPLVTKAMVAQDNLTNGVINTSLMGFEPGNSGGPVFYRNNDGEFVAVGIVSIGKGSIGVITPIGNMW